MADDVKEKYGESIGGIYFTPVALSPNDRALLTRIAVGIEALAPLVTKLNKQVSNMIPVIQDVVDAVADETTVVQSAVTLLDQLETLLTQAVATNDPAKIQAAIDAISSNKKNLADAVLRNTPQAPVS